MISFLKRKSSPPSPAEPDNETTKTSFFQKLKQGLSKTRHQISQGVSALFLGKKVIDEELMAALETQLILADVGIETTAQIMTNLTALLSRKELSDPNALLAALQKQLVTILKPVAKPLTFDLEQKPIVILMVGVNGSGKTTTIGKIAHVLQQQSCKVMLAAGDTFRAAAIEQLQSWGQRNGVPVIAQHTGADSASVVFDALQAAQARDIDVLLADSAGRLHTQANLMQELAKIKRVLGKLDAKAPHEVLLVLDATTGQSALRQAKQFHKDIGITGIVITKLDGTAKGGIIFAIADQLQIPIRFIGMGEGLEDLRPFVAEDFVAAVFDLDPSLVNDAKSD